MEQGVNTAVKAADGIIAADPILGSIVVILGLALLGMAVWHVVETRRLNKELLDSERQHGKDSLTMQSSVATALETVRQALEFISKRGQ